MKLTNNFFNKVVVELDKKYFPDVKFYRDNKKTTAVHYACELFNNGCSTYGQLINKLSKSCIDTKENIHVIVSKHVENFEGYNYKP